MLLMFLTLVLEFYITSLKSKKQYIDLRKKIFLIGLVY